MVKSLDLDHNFLFFNSRGKPLTRASGSAMLKRVSQLYMGKRLSVNLIRHVLQTDFESGNPSLKQRLERLNRMQQKSIYRGLTYAKL